MKVGIIAPISMLEEYCTTKTQYCLPKLLVDNESYRDFYKDRKRKNNTIIMDSRKVGSWKREPEDPSIIKEALDILEPNYLILPSWMFNWKRTVRTIGEFLDKVEYGSSILVAPLEGTNGKEIDSLKVGLESIENIKNFALPEHVQSFCKAVECDRPIIYIENHLRIEELQGLDGLLVTSLPVRLGLQGRLLSDYLPGPPSLTFYEEENLFPKVVNRNIEELLEYYDN